MGQRYVIRNGELVRKEDAVPLEVHYVQDDTMPLTWHPADERYYDSKSAFRRVTRAAGCHEVGNDKLSQNKNEWRETMKPDRIREVLNRVWNERHG